MNNPPSNAPHSNTWYGPDYFFGLHYDLHANKEDKQLGLHCSPEELVSTLALMAPQFVQTDCKGHPGYTSWFSQTAGASIPPGLTRDALTGWREATRQLGLPLHCHYSGIWDKAATLKFPEWCVVPASAEAPASEKMCPRGPYLDKLMIPQMKELIDRYEVDGFWIDGDIWSVEPCYCTLCQDAYRQQNAGQKPPVSHDDEAWPQWWRFTLKSFEAYVTRACRAVHAHNPSVKFCSNWLQTFRHPGEPLVPTDWISGDNTPAWGLDASRCEARFLSTRGKHFDIMLWSFYRTHHNEGKASPATFKPVEMLMQEAAALLAFGGAVQIYEHGLVRDGRLAPWRMRQMGLVGQFIKARRELCQGSSSWPQVAVLHSETHLYANVRSDNLLWGPNCQPVQGAVYSLLENHLGVDILDEWALLPRLREFPIVVVPEQDKMSSAMVEALQEYVRQGGHLILAGTTALNRFPEEFLGATVLETKEKATYHVPLGTHGPEGAAPLYSEAWGLLKTTTARTIGVLGTTQLLTEELTPYPAATLNTVGIGQVATIPAAIFTDFDHNRTVGIRRFVGQVVSELCGDQEVTVSGPTCVDIALRRQGDRRIIHLLNRSSGLPNSPQSPAIDEIMPVGPVEIKVKMSQPPQTVHLAFEHHALEWSYQDGLLTVKVAAVRIHCAAVID